MAENLRVRQTGSPSNAVIAQFGHFVQQMGPDAFRGKNEVLVLNLLNTDEPVSDPFAYFLEKAAASAFELTSKVMVKCQTEPPCFIPWTPFHKYEPFKGIGVLIGIIVRTGKYQKFPLAPAVWKYLAGDEITAEDILELDPDLKVRQGASPGLLRWQVPNWDGKVVVLPGHSDDPVVHDADLYIDECVSLRRKEMYPFLREIRAAMRANLGIVRHTTLTPDLLRELVNGP
jgi:hypothetical protein